MHSVYTTTITDEARRRGIRIDVIDAQTPIFVLKHAGRRVRCYNALTDQVGAVTFHLAQDKHLANGFLRRHGLPVPHQIKYTNMAAAREFLRQTGSLVVKPCREWGGRGVSVAVKTEAELTRAVRRARKYGEDLVLEEFVVGIDFRVIVVGGRYVAAIERRPAHVLGNGRDNIRRLIIRKNYAMRQVDASCRIPLDAETARNLACLGWRYDAVPAGGQRAQVRLTTNYHTGGEVLDVTDRAPRGLVQAARRIARLLGVPILGVDFLADAAGRNYRVVELSPDLAISPPEGARVAVRFLDHLFPETRLPAGRA
ncbi:MAG: hypothetical protein ABR497_01445 [Kiritimatiellia bacterium]